MYYLANIDYYRGICNVCVKRIMTSISRFLFLRLGWYYLMLNRFHRWNKSCDVKT